MVKIIQATIHIIVILVFVIFSDKGLGNFNNAIAKLFNFRLLIVTNGGEQVN